MEQSEYVKKLISSAALAQDIFGDDELEFYASELERNKNEE